ncbi:MAG: secondary thiamine-phosphate synthase enzyme YjbQ [Christensenellales bacterium]|jgi:secondary thiamine-phosphate synthase enzyme|nr:YjbQ family protein [Clostridiales bacterium]
MYKFSLKTNEQGLYDITKLVRQAVYDSGRREGLCVVYCPHTTAAITINENADMTVREDIAYGLEKAFPNRAEFNHLEGNSDAHIKSSVLGVSQTLIIDKGELVLGTWQSIFFAEFDPPRNRFFYVKII